MKSYLQPQFISDLKDKFLFFDTNSLIAIIAYEKLFSPIIAELKKVECVFMTIPSVIFEFSRTDSIAAFNTRNKFVKGFASSYPIEKHLNEFSDLILVLQKINGKMSYTDFLLYCCLYKFPDAYLITENHKDFLTTILDRSEIIVVDNDSQGIRNLALYKFCKEKYEKIASNILSGK